MSTNKKNFVLDVKPLHEACNCITNFRLCKFGAQAARRNSRVCERLLFDSQATSCRFAEQFKSETTIERNITDITDPVRAYIFIKNLSEDWKRLKSLLHANNADSYIRDIDDERLSKAVCKQTST